MIPVEQIFHTFPYMAEDSIWNMALQYRYDYVRTKYEVAERLKPKRIAEIGVYSGISAYAFLLACPNATYVGIDNLYSEQSQGIEVVSKTSEFLTNAGYDVKIIIADSQGFTELPYGPFDLVHVDGDHSCDGASHDVLTAWNSMNSGGHILVDNGHDAEVCKGTFHAVAQRNPGIFNWSYINEGVGSILIEKP